MRKKEGEERTPAEDSTLLRQPDLGGGQRPEEEQGRPKGTHPVSAFAGALEKGGASPGASGVWRVAPGEAVEPAGAASEVRGALYDGPERRKHQVAWDQWQARDRRERPFAYAGDQRV